MQCLASSVAVVGCGALGTVIASTLVRAGVGTVKIIDRDYIELNNLQRKVLFDAEDIAKGLPKAIAAAEKLKRINSQVARSLSWPMSIPIVLTVFRNGRVIIKGTADATLARTLYARYVSL